MAKRKSTKGSIQAQEVAAAYLRRSVKAARGAESRESSIERQTELAERYCRRHKIGMGEDCVFADAGVRGWKRGEDRPGWRNMLAAAQEGRFNVLLVENIDRFSRATVGEVYQDALKVRAAGVTRIVETQEGGAVYDLGDDENIGAVLQFVVAVWSANEFSRKLSLRITETRRRKALEGVRTAGAAAYGYDDDGKGGLALGDPARIAIVRQIFAEYAAGKSADAISAELNARGIKSPRGALWGPSSVKGILRRRAYLGEFRYGDTPQGKFHRLDEKGDVVRADEAEDGKVIVVPNAHPAIVDADTFARVARRMARNSEESRRERGGMHVLSRILRCGKCGEPMYGVSQRGYVYYKCGRYIRHGFAGCDSFQIAEPQILPVVIELATTELAKLEMLAAPSDVPEEIAQPWKARAGKLADLEAERADVSAKLDAAVENCLFADASLRQRADKIIAKLRRQEAQLDAQIDALRSEASDVGYFDDELERLAEYQERLRESLLEVETRDGKITCDRQKLRALLDEMGCRVDLFFDTQEVPCKSGRVRRRHTLSRGRFRLGLREVEFSRSGDVAKGRFAATSDDCDTPKVDVLFDGSALRAG